MSIASADKKAKRILRLRMIWVPIFIGFGFSYYKHNPSRPKNKHRQYDRLMVAHWQVLDIICHHDFW
ncbi:MAG: hypothetical protein IH948_05450 [Bacteroidetes bacterium]|nr:hypothetical protein [Bacteroidota bacterium]